MSTAVQTSATPNAVPSFSSPISLSGSYHVPIATRLGQDGRQRRILRRMTSVETSPHPPNRHTEPDDREADTTEPPTHPPARRSSWIKRLSTTMSNSQQSSRNSSPGPLSPSIACSNGSMAFSHDGSTVPIVGKRSPSPLPPNKLVKRSSSVRASSRDQQPRLSGSRLPSLRRPATSHQRSVILHQNAALVGMPLEEQPLPYKSDSDVEYSHFFRAKVAKEKTLSKRGGSAVNVKSLKRIYPGEKDKPTLLLAKSVSPGAGDPEETSSEDGESVFFLSRPGTPMSITAVIATSNDGSDAVETKPYRGRRPVDVTDDAQPRRSFSITDFLSPGKQRTSKVPGAKLSRKSSQRVSSAPLPLMGSRQSVTAHGELSTTSVRRDLTDPALARREISTSSGPSTGNLRNGLRGESPPSSSPLPALPSHRPGTGMMADHTLVSMHQSDVKPSIPANANHIPPSPTLGHTGGRPSRHSVAPSEQASTLVGSDSEARGVGSGDEDDADIQSETVFDSLRTGATRSTSGARGPRIETIFDESPPSKVKVTALRDLLPRGTFREQAIDGAPGQQSIAEEEESISTPVRTIIPERSIHESPSLNRGLTAPLFPTLIPSSPPDMPKPLSLGTLEWDTRAEDDDDSSRWSINEEDEDEGWGDLPSRAPATFMATPMSLGRHNPRLLASGSSPKPSTPQHSANDHGDRDARSSIFDWSEQQPTDKGSGNRSPPRPRTVHGKKDADRRGSRSVGRRAPSGLHARSQSVPVVPDATGKRSTVVTNKFGTWGVGSKGVTEDWNDDFDFSDSNERSATEGAAESHRVDSGTVMFVPKNIQEQQSNVLANIGLLREWGLLIEELKEQRIRATALDILEGPHASMWEEVDAMIDLADQEAEHDGVPRLSPPSTPGFDEDAFDDMPKSSPNHNRGKRTPGLASEALGRNHAPPISQPNRPRRRSILPPNGDIFGPQSSPIPYTARHASPTATSDPKPITTRPRKDSEAKARYVIESLQKRRSTHDALGDAQPVPTKKVPFDTATLRRIVPYVNTLTRKVKDALRDAEGLYSSPVSSPSDPHFTKMFPQTDNDIATQMKLMTVM